VATGAGGGGLLKEPVLSSEAAQAAEAEAEIREAWRTWILADSRTGLLVRRMKEMLAEATSVMDETASESLLEEGAGREGRHRGAVGLDRVPGGIRV
jgi:hypothetical protein